MPSSLLSQTSLVGFLPDDNVNHQHGVAAHVAVETTEIIHEVSAAFELKLKTHDMDPRNVLQNLSTLELELEVNLIGLCLLPIRLIAGLIASEVAQMTEGSHSQSETYDAVSKTLDRIENKLEMLRFKDFNSAMAKADNAARAKMDFEKARDLAIEAYSTVDPMDKIACTELRICSAAGCVSDQELVVEARTALGRLVHDKSVIQEVRASSGPWFFSSSRKKNNEFLARLYRLIASTLKGLPDDQELHLFVVCPKWTSALCIDNTCTDFYGRHVGPSLRSVTLAIYSLSTFPFMWTEGELHMGRASCLIRHPVDMKEALACHDDRFHNNSVNPADLRRVELLRESLAKLYSFKTEF